MKRDCESCKAPLGDSAPASHMFLGINADIFCLSVRTCQLCLTASRSWHAITCCVTREQSKNNGVDNEEILAVLQYVQNGASISIS